MSPSAPNILLVMLDSVRADFLGCYGHAGANTPALDALAAAGVRFANTYSESTWTLPVSSSVFTGLAPREHRMEFSRHLPEVVPTLPQVMRAAGYTTFGASNNPFFGADTGLSEGCDQFFVPHEPRFLAREYHRHIGRALGQSDAGGAAVVASFQHWVREAPRPWFAALWLNDAHHHYRVPGWTRVQPPDHRLSFGQRQRLTEQLRHPRRLEPTPELRSYLDALYTHAVNYVDTLIGAAVAAVEASGEAANTVVIVGADHGDMLGEHGLMGHGAPAGVYDPLIRVPLIMRAPGLVPAVSPALVQTSDITETIAAIAGAAPRLAPTAGERVDLREAASGFGRVAAFCEREPLSEARLARERAKTPRFDFTPHDCQMTAVIADGWKLILRDPGPGELYCLKDDPGETRDLLAEQPQRAEFLRGLAADFHARAVPDAAVTGAERDDAEVVDRRLQDLGYV